MPSDRSPPIAIIMILLSLFFCGTYSAFGQTGTQDPTQLAGPTSNGWASSVIKSGASQTIIDEYKTPLTAHEEEIRKAGEATRSADVADRALVEIPGALHTIRDDLRQMKEALVPKLQDAKVRLEKIGESPKDNEVAETEEIIEKRENLSAEVVAYDSLIKLTDVLIVRAKQIIDAANLKRRQRFTRQLLRPAPTLLSRNFWRTAMAGIGDNVTNTLGALRSIAGDISRQSTWLWFLLILFPSALFVALRWTLKRLISPNALQVETAGAVPPRSARSSRALTGTIVSLIPMIAAAWAFYVILDRLSVFTFSAGNLTVNLIVIFIVALFLFVLCWKSLSPRLDKWSLLQSADVGARRRIAITVTLLISAWTANEVLAASEQSLNTPYELIVLRSLVVALSIAVLISCLLTIRLDAGSGEKEQPLHGWPRWLVFAGILVISAILFFAALGYVALANFLAEGAVATAVLLALFYLVRQAAEFGVTKFVREDTVSQDSAVDPVLLASGIVLDVLLVAALIPLLLIQWGFDWITVRGWIAAAFFGFDIGGFTISIQSLVVALAIFVVGLVLTRLVQRWFERRSGATAVGGSGVRDSVHTILGYTGFVIALLAAISFLGINLTNLAIVAGALSVGIGFGLQSIFNNFVSGLILLVERPIKVGDYIRVGTDEGSVKRITVRATEIETLDRQSVIVPNARLITDPVINWMHSDLTSRVIIPVGVSYASNVDNVRKTLEQVAKENSDVLDLPEPYVHFAGYGDSALEFELRAYIPDARRRIRVAGDLRFQIWHALKAASIEIPFPQRDVHLKGQGKDALLSNMSPIQS